MTAEKQRLTEGLSLFTVVLSIPGALVWMRTKTVRVAGCRGFVIANGIRLTCVLGPEGMGGSRTTNHDGGRPKKTTVFIYSLSRNK